MSTAVAKKIIKQVEFYFSDSNLPRDKFLREITKTTPEGWCPIETIASFSRMKQLTEDVAVVVSALKESSFLVVSEDDKNVRRKEALPEGKVDAMPRSLYMKGFPEDFTLEQVQEVVEKLLEEGEKLLYTRMRRFKGGENDKKFKGSVFLEFNTTAAAERVCKLTVKATEDGEALLVEMKLDYWTRKQVEKADKRAQKKDNKKRKGEEKDEAAVEEEEKEEEIVKDLIVKVDNVGGTEDGKGECERKDLKDLLEGAGGSVAYIEYAFGQPFGYCRLKETSEVMATELAKKLEGKEIKGHKAVFVALAGEEEAQYWQKVRANQKNLKGGKGGKGGKGRKKQRRD